MDSFHGSISRKEAEEILIKDGEGGSFLVRESSSSVGDYTISFLSVGVVHHVQIHRHDGDAFFSIEGGQVTHGLDELIRHYQGPNSINDDDILLQKGIIKSSLPPDSRRHGRTNLLHRATKEGSTEIVLEMVRCGHRSLDAKNEEGQTAAHLAAIGGSNAILSILIRAGTNVNAKDSASKTPLHYACINNLPETVKILLEEGNANPQIRKNDDGYVPMHEAAARGHLDCVKVLSKNHVPLRPRTLDYKLPIHLALAANEAETIRYFDSVKCRSPLSNRDDWYHGSLERKEALRSLQLCQNSYPNNDPATSYYLIRRHSQKNNLYVLTILFQGHTYNFEIEREEVGEVSYYFIDDGPYLDSLEHVVDHYTRWKDGLPSTLHVPVRPTKTLGQEDLNKIDINEFYEGDGNVNLTDVLNWTATMIPDNSGENLRIGVLKSIMWQMSSNELKKIPSMLSHAKYPMNVLELKWKKAKQERVMVAPENSVIALPVSPLTYLSPWEFKQLTNTQGWWKKFKKSDFISFDVEFVQVKKATGLDVHKAGIVAMWQSEEKKFLKNIKWDPSEVDLTDFTIKLNGITYKSILTGESLKEVSMAVEKILRNKIVLTVGGDKDFRSINLESSEFLSFDLQTFYYRHDPNNYGNHQGLSLRDMFYYHFKKDIQQGQHCCLADAKNTYTTFMYGYIKGGTSFWNAIGLKIIDFDKQINLNAQEKKKLLWCETMKAFGRRCGCLNCKVLCNKKREIVKNVNSFE